MLAVLVLGEAGPSVAALVTGLVAVCALAWFAHRQTHRPDPLVDFGLYRDRHFAGGSVAAAVLTLGTGSALFVLTQYLQLVRGQTPLLAGAALAPLAAGIVIGSFLGGWVTGRVGPRPCIVGGFVALASGFLLLAALDGRVRTRTWEPGSRCWASVPVSPAPP